MRVRRAQFVFEDELNDARWYLPEAEFVIRPHQRWAHHAGYRISRNFRRTWGVKLKCKLFPGNQQVSVQAQVSDVVPVDVANKIYALFPVCPLQVAAVRHCEFHSRK